MSLFGTLFGTRQEESTKAITSSLSLVTYAAGLASNTSAIDPLLDRVRGISAGLGQGQTPSPADDQTLLKIYLKVEEYLTTKEPLRTFTKEELRARAAPALRSRLEALDK